MKKFLAALILSTLLFTAFSCTNNTVVKGSVIQQSVYGNAELDIMPQKLLEIVGVGNTVVVCIGNFEEEMPFVEELIKEDGTLQLFHDKEDGSLSVCLYNQRFCDIYGIRFGEKVVIRKK